MTARLARIFRHPLKGIGSEVCDDAALSPEGALHGDRAWALLNEAAPDIDGWQPRRNFLQVASGPGLAPIRVVSEANGLRLSHPEKPDLHLRPEEDTGALAGWLAGLWPEGRPGPARLVHAPGHGMTDMAEPYVSVGSLSSLRALSERAGQVLDPRRFRINLWVEDWAPWEEAALIGRRFQIGTVPFDGAEPIGRCRAPEADPETGMRDVNVLRILEEGWGHPDFGIYARVAAPGAVRCGDPVSAL